MKGETWRSLMREATPLKPQIKELVTKLGEVSTSQGAYVELVRLYQRHENEWSLSMFSLMLKQEGMGPQRRSEVRVICRAPTAAAAFLNGGRGIRDTLVTARAEYRDNLLKQGKTPGSRRSSQRATVSAFARSILLDLDRLRALFLRNAESNPGRALSAVNCGIFLVRFTRGAAKHPA